MTTPPPIAGNFSSYRRRLPHFRLEGATYLVNWRVHPSLPELPERARSIVLQSLLHFNTKRYDLLGCVVMDDHVHLLLTPFEGWPLEKLVQNWKSFSAHRINKALDRSGPVWLEEYYDRIMRDDAEFREKLEYVYKNPMERWPERKEYPYLWIKELS